MGDRVGYEHIDAYNLMALSLPGVSVGKQEKPDNGTHGTWNTSGPIFALLIDCSNVVNAS